MSTVSPSQEEILNDLLSKIKTRGSYAGAFVKTALARTQGGLNMLTTLAIASDESRPPRERHEYGPLVLVEGWYSKDQFIEWVSMLARDQKLGLPGGEQIDVKGNWQPVGTINETYLSSNYQYLEIDWPSNIYRYYLQQGTMYPPSDIPTSPSLPMFPSGMEAVEWWLSIGELRRMDLIGKVLVMLPNYAARIRDVEITSKQLSLSIEKREERRELLAKSFVKYQSSQQSMQDQDVAGPEVKFDIGSDWVYLRLGLLDKKTGETLDYRTIYAGWTDLPKGVVWKAESGDLSEIIRRGERDDVEFKENLTNHDDIVKTIVAFANTRGGLLLIGVNDECQPVGTKEDPDAIEERVRNWVREGCEQAVQLEIQSSLVLDRPVVAITVKQSSDRPCWVRGKGPYVRYGSSNRLATRSEVEQMLRKETQQLGFA